MFKIDRQANRIEAPEQKRFCDLGFSERQHLQEWLAHTPEALGEELLIIQKEFDGFDDNSYVLKPGARAKLYVGITRAKRSATVVLKSQENDIEDVERCPVV